MMKRCYNPKHVAYARYGGSGVTVAERWHSFDNFFEDMGQRPDPRGKWTLDRWPNKYGNYEPGNCRWATWTQQARNHRIFCKEHSNANAKVK